MKTPAMLVAVVGLMLGPLIAEPATADAPASAKRPNIVIILADDQGWADVGFHGSEIKTPELDRLAASGARLEQFYVQPVCSPTRAALMTGRYPMRYGLQVGVVRPWAQYGLPLEERTLAQALAEAGYETAICGKWHLGHFRRDYLPTRRGFDHQYGHYNGALDYFTHQRDGGHDWHRDDQACYDQGYSTFLLADEAVRLIRRHDTAKPLFLYVPFNAVHSPHQEILFNAAPASGAILVGSWKLVIRGEAATAENQQARDKPRRKRGKARREPIELFNLAEDPYEKENLASKHPDKVKELRARYEKLASQAVPPKTAPKAPGFQSPKIWGQQQ